MHPPVAPPRSDPLESKVFEIRVTQGLLAQSHQFDIWFVDGDPTVHMLTELQELFDQHQHFTGCGLNP